MLKEEVEAKMQSFGDSRESVSLMMSILDGAMHCSPQLPCLCIPHASQVGRASSNVFRKADGIGIYVSKHRITLISVGVVDVHLISCRRPEQAIFLARAPASKMVRGLLEIGIWEDHASVRVCSTAGMFKWSASRAERKGN
jgi:hypothetical protein